MKAIRSDDEVEFTHLSACESDESILIRLLDPHYAHALSLRKLLGESAAAVS
jgi:hypothetical protein